MAIQWGKHEFHHFQVLTTNGKPLKDNAMKYQGLHFVTVLPGRNDGRQAGSLLTPEGYEEGRGEGGGWVRLTLRMVGNSVAEGLI